MLVSLDKSFIKNKVVGVAVSGGSDSMALLSCLLSVKDLYSFSVVVVNVEHGIRGESSLKDTEFVVDYCAQKNVKCCVYKVNALKHAKEHKLSTEESARVLRYECFFDAIKSGKCDVIATAHHSKDNFESVLFNLFRGTGLKGLTGISDMDGKIIRPLLSVSKTEIEKYIEEYNIPFVTDDTNFDQSYSRNFIRSSVIPVIESRFKGAEKNVYNFSKIAKLEDEFLDSVASGYVKTLDNSVKISGDIPSALIFRATIIALKALGIKKDWESAHLKRVYDLFSKNVGKTEDLLSNVIAVKERDGITLTKKTPRDCSEIDFSISTFNAFNKTLNIEKVDKVYDLKSGLYGDLDKIPEGAKIRLRKDGDIFRNCNSKTKNLSDFLVDKKVPLLVKDTTPVLAIGSEVLVIFGLAVSDKIKVSDKTKNIIKFTKED